MTCIFFEKSIRNTVTESVFYATFTSLQERCLTAVNQILINERAPIYALSRKIWFNQLLSSASSQFSKLLTMNVHALRRTLLTLSFFVTLVFSSSAQNFEVSQNISDSLSPTSYLFHVSGYATFSDSMVMEIELRANDSLNTVVYSASKDFSTGGVSTLTNFTYDATSEVFSLDIGTYSSLDYTVHVISKINGVLQEELLIHNN